MTAPAGAGLQHGLLEQHELLEKAASS